MTSALLGLPFFRKNNIVIHPFKGLHCLPELTISLALSRKYDRKLSKQQILHTFSKITIHPNQKALKNILPDEEATSTVFNALSFNETTNLMTEALNSIAATNSELIKMQKELRNNMQRFSRGINQRRPYRGFMRSSGNANNNNYRGQNSFANRPHQNRGSWTNRGQLSQRFQYSYRGRDNLFCHCCGQPGHKRSDCWFRPLPERGTNILFNRFDPSKNRKKHII